jgi:hypothetical protein
MKAPDDLEFIVLLVALAIAVTILRGQMPGPLDRDRLNQLQIDGSYAR